MRIECPACSASYEVPAARVAPGRSVKCARCGERWQPIPPEEPVMVVRPVPVPVEVPEEAIAAEPDEVVWAEEPVSEPGLHAAAPPATAESEAAEPPPNPAAPRVNKAIALAWLATVLILAGAGWAIVAYRPNLLHAWPPIERVYVGLGLSRTPTP